MKRISLTVSLLAIIACSIVFLTLPQIVNASGGASFCRPVSETRLRGCGNWKSGLWT